MGHSAVIIGAGISGLSTARALKRHGWSVTVLEQAAALPTSGTMLGMWPAAMKALDDIGVDASRRTDGWAHNAAGAGTRLWTQAGRTLLTAPGGADLNLVSRPALLAALARDIDVSFNTQVVDPGQIDDAALVVGADGTFSRTRQRMFGDRFRARSLGAVAWRAPSGAPGPNTARLGPPGHCSASRRQVLMRRTGMHASAPIGRLTDHTCRT
ncbi:NAD(P)/FAD-dependent oxidoreductase [Arthrobacter sp. 4R501]|uniref:FAD-dependent oxidoreductase n=1 Tax=Arthrobacter sp. 4R501 TaxID=2058886 RepID=UPI000CE56670|nr:FAD-dependent oxidoreductase [Arthrobacter sp. 4R501]